MKSNKLFVVGVWLQEMLRVEKSNHICLLPAVDFGH